MSKLLILTVEWPFGKGETFFENEIVYADEFDEIECMPLYKTEKQRKIPQKVNIFTIDKKLNKIVDTIQGVLNKFFFEEYKQLNKNKRLSIVTLKELVRVSMVSNYRYRNLLKWLKKNKEIDNLTIYTYWMASDAVAVSRLKAKGYKVDQFVTRCHRFDLYEYAAPQKYIPYRKLILENVDRVFPISEDAYMYLKHTYDKKYLSKYKIARLGTMDHGINPQKNKNSNKMVIVSCSNLIPVKRIDIMLSALMEVTSSIEWFHFGDGILKDNLNEMVNKLPGNVSFSFMGRLTNNELMEWYSSNHVDLFVNTSESEGIPVSIMEAMSFGIPVLATNVGGTGEIVKHRKNGILVEKDVGAFELATIIENFYNNCEDEQQKYRKNAREYWETYYSAKVNYNMFYTEFLK